MYNSITLKADGTIVTENDKAFNGATPSEINMLSGVTAIFKLNLIEKSMILSYHQKFLGCQL